MWGGGGWKIFRGGGFRNFQRGGGRLEIFQGGGEFLRGGGGGFIKFLWVEFEKIWMGLEFFGSGRDKKYFKTQHFKKLFRDQEPNPHPLNKILDTPLIYFILCHTTTCILLDLLSGVARITDDRGGKLKFCAPP